jgi:Fe-Mn family superoxide dismutase
MDRRTFIIKSSGAGIGGALMLNSLTGNLFAGTDDFTPYVSEAPAYAFDALEPHIDTETMRIHAMFHHTAYTKNLNTALASQTKPIQALALTTLFEKISELPDALRTQIENHGGGHWNHNFFWKCMRPSENRSLPEGKLQEWIVRDFDSLENFRTQFKSAALSVFGSGWAWLVSRQGKLSIEKTMNQKNPLMGAAQGYVTPVLGIDVWEHAYYLKHQNRRAEYIDSFWNVVDWDFAQSQIR